MGGEDAPIQKLRCGALVAQSPAMTVPPTGTITFLFSDIEGSTKKWEKQPDAMQGGARGA